MGMVIWLYITKSIDSVKLVTMAMAYMYMYIIKTPKNQEGI